MDLFRKKRFQLRGGTGLDLKKGFQLTGDVFISYEIVPIERGMNLFLRKGTHLRRG